ncbi:MAG: TonB-dependent receptor [Bacteroidetes bacterium]|nr:TonB-dependent receptor [Bacteroidota bacterium]
MKAKTIISLVILLITKFGFAQNEITGKILDSQTKEPLPGVSVVITGANKGTITNVNGLFILLPDKEIDSLTISYVGYETMTVKYKENMIVQMNPSIIQLNQVIVSASRDKELRTDAPIAISTLSPKEIKEARATRIDELLNKVNGVYMIDLGNEQHAMGGMRQPFNNYSNPVFLYLEDGIPIRPTGIFNHNALIEINMADIKTIEVIGGPSSAIYGSEAVGGAVNFITKQPPLVPTLNVSVQGNNLGYKRTDFSAGNTFKKLGINISGYYANRRNGYRDHSDFDKLSLSFKANYNISDKTKLNASLAYIDYKTDMTGGLDSANFFGNNYSSLQTFTYRTVDALRAKSTLSHYWNENSKTNLTVYCRQNAVDQNPHYTQKRIDPNNPLKEKSEIDNNEFNSIGLVVQHTKKFSFLNAKLTLGASADYTYNDKYKQYIEVDVNEDGVKTGFTETDSLLRDYDVTFINSAAYAQFEISPVERLKIAATSRYDQFNYDYQQAIGTHKYDGVNVMNKFIPKIGLVYDLKKNRGVYANYSVGFLPPSTDELYRNNEANQDLKPAVYNNGEIGGWFSIENKLKIQIAVFHLNGTDEIVSVVNDYDENENQNAGKTQHRGIEYTILYSPVKDIMLRIAATNVEHKYIDYVLNGNDYSGEIMEMSPSFIANAEITYRPRFLKNSRIGIEWQHLSEYFAEAPKETGTRRVYEGFDVFNIRVGYEFKRFETWFNIMNCTNELYAVSAAVSYGNMEYRPGTPRTFGFGIAYKFIGNKKN